MTEQQDNLETTEDRVQDATSENVRNEQSDDISESRNSKSAHTEDNPESLNTEDKGHVSDNGEENTDSGKSKASREAAKYRTQLREVQNERDQLQTKVDNFSNTLLTEQLNHQTTIRNNNTKRTTEVKLKHPQDFLTMTNQTPTNFITKKGTFDHDKYNETITTLYNERPELFNITSRAPILHNIGNPVRTNSKTEFQSAFDPRRN